MTLNPLGGLDLKNRFFKKDAVIIDTFLFRLHHQINFVVIGLGVLFIFAENYLDGKAITCHGNADSFAVKYCWMYGTGHVGETLKKEITDLTGGICTSKKAPSHTGDSFQNEERLTAYYIWLPFLLLISMGFSKLGRVVWKEGLERGLLRKILVFKDGVHGPAEKIAQKLIDESSRSLAAYAFSFVTCEILNLVGVIVSMSIFNRVLGGQFWNYGSDFVSYISRGEEEIEEMSNPMCDIFPTIVSCNVKTGGATSLTDSHNHVCLLSNNLFNMYYFLILWFWWVVLIALSIYNLVLRVAAVLIPSLLTWKLGQLTSLRLGHLKHLNYPLKFMLIAIKDNVDSETFFQIVEEVGRRLDTTGAGDSNDTLLKTSNV